MQSSSGSHFIALDHVRALAAFAVFSWHFTHGANGYPVPFEFVPTLVPFALLDEGHTGVALFMVLSGYLFAKLLNGKSVSWAPFLWNRLLRLLPLLALVIVIEGCIRYLLGSSWLDYARAIAVGWLYPSLPNGGWSITVEAHYYLALPVLLWMLRRSDLLPFSIIAAALALRTALYFDRGEIQSLSYWTLVGRIDQFALGMIMFQFRERIAGRHGLVLVVLGVFAYGYWLFDAMGGFYGTGVPNGHLWIFLPTLEGVAYAVGIAWYDSSFRHSDAGVSRWVGRIGEISYSMYLLHFFVVFHAARLVHENVMDLSDFYVASVWALICFLMLCPIARLSFRYIESPFLKLRRPYVLHSSPPLAPAPASPVDRQRR